MYVSMSDNAMEVVLDPYIEGLEHIIKKYKGEYSNDKKFLGVIN